MGVISSLGHGVLQTTDAIRKGSQGIRPLSLFSTSPNQPLPVGQVPGPIESDSLPRTHQLARLAADQAMAACDEAPDAVVLGITTGGMSTTEALLKKEAHDPELFRYHAAGSVAEDIARRYRCTGPVITVSTACSSGTVAIKIALEMLRAGQAERVLVGGADSLCLITYFGFNALQLIDPDGARPFDKNRRGMSVAEGAGMLLLVAESTMSTSMGPVRRTMTFPRPMPSTRFFPGKNLCSHPSKAPLGIPLPLPAPLKPWFRLSVFQATWFLQM